MVGAQLRTKPVPIAHGGGEDSGVAVVPLDEVGEGHGDRRGVAVVVVLLLDVSLGAHQDARDIWAQRVQRGQHLTLQRIEPDHQAFKLACAVVRCVVGRVVSRRVPGLGGFNAATGWNAQKEDVDLGAGEEVG